MQQQDYAIIFPKSTVAAWILFFIRSNDICGDFVESGWLERNLIENRVF